MEQNNAAHLENVDHGEADNCGFPLGEKMSAPWLVCKVDWVISNCEIVLFIPCCIREKDRKTFRSHWKIKIVI